jgi:hypothetical protein
MSSHVFKIKHDLKECIIHHVKVHIYIVGSKINQIRLKPHQTADTDNAFNTNADQHCRKMVVEIFDNVIK